MNLESKPEVFHQTVSGVYAVVFSNLKFLFFLLPCFFLLNISAQTLNLRRNTDTFRIKPFDDLTLLIEKRGVKHDSLEMMIRGKLLTYKNDTLRMTYNEFAIHNYYRKAADSLHYFYDALQDTQLFMKVPVSHIYGIYRHRSKLTSSMTRVVFVTLGLSLATMPFVLALKPSPAHDVISKINITSAATMLAAAAVGIIFAKKKFWIRPKYKKSWTVVP